MLSQNRYVSVEGIPGIGKSAIVKHIANMLYDRAIFTDGYLYVTLRDCNSLEGLFKKIHLSIKAFINDSAGIKKSTNHENLEASDIYWEILRMLKDLDILLILDNCREIIAKDQSSYREFIQDVLEKLPRIRILMTCVYSVPLMNDVKVRVYKVGTLSSKETLDLLKLCAESPEVHNKELNEMIQADPSVYSKIKHNIFDHELFTFLDGHPLSVVILSSLRKSMSLLETFELLRMIKDNYKDEIIDQSTLSLMLSVEASLIFAKKEKVLSYEILLVFSLSPSGYLKTHLLEMFGEAWNECENLLVSRSLIKAKTISIANQSDTDFFTMDLALARIIKSRTSTEELEESYRKVLVEIMQILEVLLALRDEDINKISDIL